MLLRKEQLPLGGEGTVGGGLLTTLPCPPLPVFVTLTCAFRYGREDLDVLGLSFRKDLFIANYQAFPPTPNPPRPPTRLQDRLLRKLGKHAHPFFFTVRTPPPSAEQGVWDCVGGGVGGVRHLLRAGLGETVRRDPRTPASGSPCTQEALASLPPPGAPSFFLSLLQESSNLLS